MSDSDVSSGSAPSKPKKFSLNDWRKKSGITCSFVIFAALNIALMVEGIKNLHKCRVEPMVPIYLIGG